MKSYTNALWKAKLRTQSREILKTEKINSRNNNRKVQNDEFQEKYELTDQIFRKLRELGEKANGDQKEAPAIAASTQR